MTKLLLCFFLFLSVHPALWAQLNARPQTALQAFRNGRFEEAVQIARNEVAVNPNNLELYIILSRSLVNLGRYEEGRTYALAGRSISRYDPRLIEILGEVYYFQGRNNEALQYFQEYISLAPQGERVFMAYYYIGEIFIRQGRYRRADIALSTAVYYIPHNAIWWARLAYARENAGEFRSALTAYEQALTLNENLSEARNGRDRTRAQLINQ